MVGGWKVWNREAISKPELNKPSEFTRLRASRLLAWQTTVPLPSRIQEQLKLWTLGILAGFIDETLSSMMPSSYRSAF